MALICAVILISAVIVIITGSPSILTLNPTLLPIRNLLPAENLLSEENVLPKPYQFGYEFADGLGMNQHRQEVADSSGAVKGSYGYVDHLGVNRVVEYTADKHGYNAVVKSNEPGIVGPGSANALFIIQTPPPAAIAQGLKPLVLKSL